MIFDLGELLAKASRSIQFGDLLILQLIIDYNEQFGKSPTGNYLKEHFNTFLTTHGITEARAVEMSSNWVLEARIKKLRSFGLLIPASEERTPYIMTEKGETLLRNVPKNFRDWPVSIPVSDESEVNLEDAVYLD